MDYPMALAIIGSVAFVSGGGASIFKTLYGKPVCDLHGPLMSDVASIKNAVVNLAVYVIDKSTHEGRDLQKETIDAMMKK